MFSMTEERFLNVWGLRAGRSFLQLRTQAVGQKARLTVSPVCLISPGGSRRGIPDRHID